MATQLNVLKENYFEVVNDKEFLKELFAQQTQSKFVRVTLLNFEEEPIDRIEGYIASGSINLDGDSAIRRTCNLTLVTDQLDLNLSDWGVNKKFKVEIGISNDIKNLSKRTITKLNNIEEASDAYSNPIWFNMGIYVTTGIKSSHNINSFTITLVGSDKMCLLNGDVGGAFPFISSDLSVYDELSENGDVAETVKIPLVTLIYQIVENYGNELPKNICIEIDDLGLELLNYKGEEPIFILKDYETDDALQYYIGGDQEVYYDSAELDDKNNIFYDPKVPIKLNKIPKVHLDCSSPTAVDLLNLQPAGFYQILGDEQTRADVEDFRAKVMKIETDENIGYHQIDLIYADSLVGNAGDNVVTILNKITSMLGNRYTFFYDVDGKFHFQKKTSLSPDIPFFSSESSQLDSDKDYYTAYSQIVNNVFSFEDNKYILSIDNTPDYSNLKNDFSIWGKRKSVSEVEIPVHLRFAIDSKPIKYTTYKDTYNGLKNSEKGASMSDATIEDILAYTQQCTYITGEDGSYSIDNSDPNNIKITCDWREVIYQMALDYFYYHDTREDFLSQIRDNTKVIIRPSNTEQSLYPTGKTGYEQYYTDLISFWRDLFIPTGSKGMFRKIVLSESIYKKNKYYTLKNNKYDAIKRFPTYIKSNSPFNENTIYYELIEPEPEYRDYFYNRLDIHFSESVIYSPHTLNFWLDFLDTDSELAKYSVRAIGQRGMAVDEENVKAIYYKTVPNMIFVPTSKKMPEPEDRSSAYTYVYSNENLENNFSVSSSGISAWDYLQTLLNTNTYAKEEVTIQAIPLYFLLPFDRIILNDSINQMYGTYEISKITYSLDFKATMSITASKVIENIY